MRPAFRSPLILLLAVAAWSCSDSIPTQAPEEMEPEGPGLPDVSGVPVSSDVLTDLHGPPEVCSAPTEVDLMLGSNFSTGTVTVANDEESIFVTYRSDQGRSILGTALFVGDGVEEIPLTRWGTPRILRFPYVSGHPWGTEEVVWEIPLDEVSGSEAVIAAFGQIGLLPSWGAGEPIVPGRDWAMYFTYTVSPCATETVGSQGGTITTPGGEVVFNVPVGSLTSPVEITIDPATFEELQAHIEDLLGAGPGTSTGSGMLGASGSTPAGSSASATGPARAVTLPLLENGIRPIANTIWDFGPEGLEFDPPATVTLRYDDAEIPEGVNEEELGVFVINGIYEPLPSIVDPIANTVTAPANHFSFYFVGYPEIQSTDLSVTATVANDGEPVGAEVRYTPYVTNNGPESVDGVTIVYQVYGDVVAGSMDENCVQTPNPIFGDVYISCDVGTVTGNHSAAAPEASFVAQSPGDSEVWITVLFPGIDYDPDNDRYIDTFTALERPQADLSMTTATESADPIPLGSGVTYAATIQNLGPSDVPDAQVYYTAFGNVETGDLGEGCTIQAVPPVGDIGVICVVGSLASNASAEAPPVEFVPQGTGEYTIWMSSGSPSTSDPVLENNRLEETVSVVDQLTADLSVTATVSNDNQPVGVEVEYTPYVTNHGPESVDGVTVAYQVFGDVVAGSFDEGCVETPNPIFGDVYVSCEVGAVTASHSAAVPKASFVAQSPGEYEVWITAFFEGTDPEPDNDRYTHVFTALNAPLVADLTVTGATESADPIELGLGVTYAATIQNLGPNDVPDAQVYYSAFGDVESGDLGEGCTLQAIPVVADVEVICVVGLLAANTSAQAPPAEFVPQGTGEYTIWMSPGSPTATDPDLDNNRLEETVTVEGRTADLGIRSFSDRPDPATPGTPIQYTAQVGVQNAQQTVEGARFRLNTSGNATFVEASVDGCTENLGFITCPIDPMENGVVQEMTITVQPAAGLTELAITASIVPPLLLTDPDMSDNTLYETTTIQGSVGPDPAITSLSLPAGPIQLGAATSVSATVQNVGTETATNVLFYYLFDQTATVESVGAGCLESFSPTFADVEVLCSLSQVPTDRPTSVPPMEVSFGSGGTKTVEALVFHSDDVDPGNNQESATIQVTAPISDLRIDRLVDSPDPVQPGDMVTYQVDVVSGGAATVSDAKLRLQFTGDADYVSSTASCSILDAAGSELLCGLDPLLQEITQTVELTFILTTSGQTVSLDATVETVGLTQDPDLSNNTMSTSTDVENIGVIPLAKGDVIERVLPAGGSEVPFSFNGTVGEQVRVSLAILSGGNAAADLFVVGPLGDTIVNASRAQGFWSQNHGLTLAQNGTYGITVKGLGSGYFRLGLGTGIGRGDFTYGNTGRPYLRVNEGYQGHQPFKDFEAAGTDILILGEETLRRFDDGGQFVSSFGVGGEVDLTTVFGGRAQALAVQPDGKIVVAALDGSIPYPWAVARFLPDGSLDPTFGTGGVSSFQVDSASQSLTVRPLAVGFQQNGLDLDIVVAGISASTTDRIGMARLNPDGTLDTGFGTGGVVTADGGFQPLSAAIQPDGRILVASSSQVMRFTTAGSLDTSFGSGGTATMPASGIRRVIPLPSGGIVGVGDQGDDGLVVRMSANGSPASFGTGGALLMNFGLPQRLWNVAEDAQGRLVVVGDERQVDDYYDQLVVRLEADGQFDTEFGHGGFLVVGTEIDEARDVLIDSQGRILVGGQLGGAAGYSVTRHLVN